VELSASEKRGRLDHKRAYQSLSPAVQPFLGFSWYTNPALRLHSGGRVIDSKSDVAGRGAFRHELITWALGRLLLEYVEKESGAPLRLTTKAGKI